MSSTTNRGTVVAEYLEYSTSRGATLTDGRRGLLITFGIVAILVAAAGLGIVCLSAYTILRLALAVGGRVYVPPRAMVEMIVSNVMLLALAAGVAWGGIAMIRCRRWVLAAGQVASALALAVGLLGVEWALAEFVTEEELVAGGTGDAGGYVIAILALCLVGVILPVTYLALFTRPNVRRTLEHYDPDPTWTDRFPRPVLAVRIGCFYFGMIAATWVGDPFGYCFGRFVTGWGVPAMAVTWAVLLLAASAASRSQNGLGWWLVMAVCLLYPVCVLLTLWLGSPRAMYGDLAIIDSGRYLDTKLKQWSYIRMNQTILCLLCGVTAATYLFRTRACFFGDKQPPAAIAFVTATAVPAASPYSPVDVSPPPRILTPDDPPAD